MEDYSAWKWHRIFGYVNKLRWVYETDPEEIDVPDGYRVNRGNRLRVYDDTEQKKYLGAILQYRGRRNPVSLISTSLIQHLHENDENLTFFIIELYETDLLRSQNHVTPVLTRAGSFLEHALNDRLGTDKDLSPVIRAAYNKRELTGEEVRLAQFIRLCRNDVSHNFAYFTEWDFMVHDHASVCVKPLLSSISNSWYGVDFRVSDQLSIENCLRVVEEKFGFEWLNDKVTYDDDSIRNKYVTERGRE